MSAIVCLFILVTALPLEAQRRVTVDTSVGVVVPITHTTVWDTVAVRESPHVEVAIFAEEERIAKGVGFRVGLMAGLGQLITRYEGPVCDRVKARRDTPCEFPMTSLMLGLVLGPTYRLGSVAVGIDGGLRGYGPGLSCESIESLCTAAQDHPGVVIAIRPHAGFDLDRNGGRDVRLELSSFLRSVEGATVADLGLSAGIVW
jgi:hypothetical protein